MWIKRKLRNPLVLYMLLFLFLMVQVFVSMQFFKEGDAYLNYRMNSKYMIQYAKAMRGNYSFFLMHESADPIQRDMKTWAEFSEKVSLYTRDVFASRYFQAESQSKDNLPINEDLHVLLDLTNLYGFDYLSHGLPRPEALIGQQKWSQLRAYYQNLGTPQDIISRLFHPHDQYLGDRAADAPVLQRQDPGYHFFMQKILHYVNLVLSDFPTMQFHAAPPAILLNQLLGNRMILLVFIGLCIFLTSTQLSDDRQLGTIRLMTSRPNGRLRYFLSSFKSSLSLAVGSIIASLLPGTLLALLWFGSKGLGYPALYLPYSYRNLAAFPLNRGEMVSDGFGIFTRGRTQQVNPGSFDQMLATIEIWKLLLIAFLFLFLLASLMLLFGFLISALSKNKNLTAAIAIFPLGLAVMSLYDHRLAAASFPFNPFAAMDIMSTATGMQDFTALAALLALAIWNVLAFLTALWVIKRKNLG